MAFCYVSYIRKGQNMKYLFKVKYFSPTEFLLTMNETSDNVNYQTAEEISTMLIYANNSGGLTQFFEGLFFQFHCDINKSYLIVGDIMLKECI